jgi:hypothetical protein
MINIKNLFPENKSCPSGWAAVGDPGDGIDSFGASVAVTEQLCADPESGRFLGGFRFLTAQAMRTSESSTATFVPSGEILEVHATWRITRSKGVFAVMSVAGTGKGTSSVVNGGPGPGTVLLDGCLVTP